MRLTDDEAALIAALRDGMLQVRPHTEVGCLKILRSSSVVYVPQRAIQKVHNDLATNATTRAYDIGYAQAVNDMKAREREV